MSQSIFGAFLWGKLMRVTLAGVSAKCLKLSAIICIMPLFAKWLAGVEEIVEWSSTHRLIKIRKILW